MNDLQRGINKARSLATVATHKTVPEKARFRAAHMQSKKKFDSFMRSELGDFYCEVDPGPMQTSGISLKTAILKQDDLAPLETEDGFFDAAYRHLQMFVEALVDHGVNFRTIGSVLELGCGGARLVRHFRCIEGARVVGTDIDANSITWCSENLPGMEFHVNSMDPPLPFDENTFDVAMASSVFTHIPLAGQVAWLNEMHRVMRPGGVFLCTVVGRFHITNQLTTAQREEMVRTGRIELVPGESGLSVSSEVTKQHDVFQSRAEVIDVFGKTFELLDYVRGKQDILVLRKRRG